MVYVYTIGQWVRSNVRRRTAPHVNFTGSRRSDRAQLDISGVERASTYVIVVSVNASVQIAIYVRLQHCTVSERLYRQASATAPL